MIFQSESNGLFHFPRFGRFTPPVFTTNVLPVSEVAEPSLAGGMFHGSAFVIRGSINCSSINPVARE